MDGGKGRGEFEGKGESIAEGENRCERQSEGVQLCAFDASMILFDLLCLELELARKATHIGRLVHAVPKLLRRRGFEFEVQTQHGKQKMNRFLKRIVAEGLRHRVLF